MGFSVPHFSLVDRTATVFRLLTIVLAAFAILLSNSPAGPLVFPVGAGYVAAAALLVFLASRLTWAWLAYPIAILDIGIVTAINILPPATPLPLWPLYLFPLASAAAVGEAPAALAAALSVAGYSGATWLTTGTISMLALWPITVLVAAAFLITTLSVQWLVERQAKRAWQEIAATLRALDGNGGPDDVATVVVERSRRLVKADRAAFWWWKDDAQPLPGPLAGRHSEHPLLPDTVVPELARRLDRGPVPLSDLGESFAGSHGELVLLRHRQKRVALLAIAWNGSPHNREARREQLRILAPSAAEALTQALAQAALQAELHREIGLRRVAMALTATLDRQVVQEVTLDAVRSILRASVSLVEPSSGRLLAGDVEIADALVRLAVDGEASGTGEASPSPTRDSRPLSATIEDNLALMAWRAHPPLDRPEAAWLEQLAALASASLKRCAEHEQLQAEEHRIRAGLEAMPEPFALWNGDGLLVLSNDSYRALVADGLESEPPRVLPETGIREEELVLGDPPRTFVAMTVTVDDGQYRATIWREITRERQALRAKEDLIAMVGHELRTPLTSIHGYSQMMSRELGIVQRQVGQLNRLIADLVDASRLEDGQLPIKRETVNPAAFARMAAERFRGAHEGRKLRLEIADAPPIQGDPARLAQVLDNLLGNAVKYSPVDQEIVLGIRAQEGKVLLSVQDHGVGIAPEHLPHLFDRFYRAPVASTERVKGLGLGLSIVRDLVAAHGGRVWAESAGPGQGSTFWVSLPARGPDESPRLLEAVGTS